MGEYKAVKRQNQHSAGADRSSQRLMRLIHNRYADSQPSRQIEMMDRIARDSMVHLQKVVKVAALSRTAENSSSEALDTFATYVRKILGHLETGKTSAFSSIRSTVEGNNGLVRIFKTKNRMKFNIYLALLDGT